MKYIMISFCLFTVFSIQAQIGSVEKITPSTTVGKVAPVGSFVAELSYEMNPADDKDTTYTLKFKDQQYKKIVSIQSVSFSGIGDTEDQLYKNIGQ